MQPAWRFAAIAHWEGFVTRHLRTNWCNIAARAGSARLFFSFQAEFDIAPAFIYDPRMNEVLMPVLIGGGQLTDRRDPAEAANPIELMAEAARLAAADAGPGRKLLDAVEVIAAVGLVVDNPETGSKAKGLFRNVPQSVCNALGINPRRKLYTSSGGNTPQLLVNHHAEQIARGEAGAVLLTGAEALNTMVGRLKQGLGIRAWADDPGSDPALLGEHRPAATCHEMSYQLQTPSVSYPLFENALRGKYRLTLDQHRARLGELYHRFSKVAAANPLAWFPTERSAREIATAGDGNRYVGFPYTKYLNSMIQVNMGAAVIMTSVSKARQLGVSTDRMVYLHGCADANEHWNLSERVNYHSSPAIRSIGEQALAMAGKTIADMDFFDIYSCFPSAVQIACDELGISRDDPRGLTLTGGLSYFGGPGNNYAMHAITTMMETLRRHPGAFGLLNANGWFVTKHSLGIYSTQPLAGAWRRREPATYQQAILDQAPPPFTETPQGPAQIETYTVLHGRKGVERALLIGRLQDGVRFLAETPDDDETLQAMMARDMLGASGVVRRGAVKNLFVPDFEGKMPPWS